MWWGESPDPMVLRKIVNTDKAFQEFFATKEAKKWEKPQGDIVLRERFLRRENLQNMYVLMEIIQ